MLGWCENDYSKLLPLRSWKAYSSLGLQPYDFSDHIPEASPETFFLAWHASVNNCHWIWVTTHSLAISYNIRCQSTVERVETSRRQQHRNCHPAHQLKMIIPGKSAISQDIIRNITSPAVQTQPCGVDLTVKRILIWTTTGTIDFDNTHRQTSSTEELPFTSTPLSNSPPNGNSSADQDPNISSETDSQINGHGSPTQEKESKQDSILLQPSSYLIEFNETVSIPLDVMGQIFVRSSLFRSGALLHAGVMDSGYTGAVGAMLQVLNPHGLRLYRGAKVAQMVFTRLEEKLREGEGYNGVYQGDGRIGRWGWVMRVKLQVRRICQYAVVGWKGTGGPLKKITGILLLTLSTWCTGLKHFERLVDTYLENELKYSIGQGKSDRSAWFCGDCLFTSKILWYHGESHCKQVTTSRTVFSKWSDYCHL